jgi:hypothetical protein
MYQALDLFDDGLIVGLQQLKELLHGQVLNVRCHGSLEKIDVVMARYAPHSTDLAGYPANPKVGYRISGRIFCSKFKCFLK